MLMRRTASICWRLVADLRVVMVAMVLLGSLSGCTRDRSIGVQYVPGERLTFYIPLCGDENLDNVRLDTFRRRGSEVDTVDLWTLQAQESRQAIKIIHFPVAPEGYRAEGIVSLEQLEAASHPTLSVAADTDPSSPPALTVFALDDMPGSDQVIFGQDDDPVPVAEVDGELSRQCSPTSLERLGALLTWGGIGALLVGGGVHVVRRRSKRSDAVQ